MPLNPKFRRNRNTIQRNPKTIFVDPNASHIRIREGLPVVISDFSELITNGDRVVGESSLKKGQIILADTWYHEKYGPGEVMDITQGERGWSLLLYFDSDESERWILLSRLEPMGDKVAITPNSTRKIRKEMGGESAVRGKLSDIMRYAQKPVHAKEYEAGGCNVDASDYFDGPHITFSTCNHRNHK